MKKISIALLFCLFAIGVANAQENLLNVSHSLKVGRTNCTWHNIAPFESDGSIIMGAGIHADYLRVRQSGASFGAKCGINALFLGLQVKLDNDDIYSRDYLGCELEFAPIVGWTFRPGKSAMV